jgi:hypothetical protein
MVNFEFEELLDTLKERRQNAINRGWAMPWVMKPTDIPKMRDINRPSVETLSLNDFGGASPDPQTMHSGPRQRQCKLCKYAPACIAVLGCGDLCLCYACALNTRNNKTRCPKCNGGIMDKDGKLQMQLII